MQLLDNKGFDKWAGKYDESISNSAEGYPFEGYYKVLNYVQNCVDLTYGKIILDLGTGTGLLTNELYNKGGKIFGIDFSEEMIKKAKEKMPEGKFYQHDFNNGIPEEVKDIRFDYIVSSYALHHTVNEEKIKLILELRKLLKKSGKIIIADISFSTLNDMNRCKIESKNYWDSSEYYFIGKNITFTLNNLGIQAEYIKISSCAGVLIIE